MNDKKISRRGVYYDLTNSPYVFTSPYGDVFKFSSQKKMEIYTRDVEKEVSKVKRLLDKYDIENFAGSYWYNKTLQCVYKSYYRDRFKR